MITQEETEIYFGSRGDDFRQFIQNMLKRGKINNKYTELLTNERSMKLYGEAFTAQSADPYRNCEVLEQLGDLSVNKFIVSYMYNRFPQINCVEGVKVAARLRINYGSKDVFFSIANSLGFCPFISASVEERERKIKPLTEDAFEAFFGATEKILDDKFRIGVGYAIVYDILANIFDEIEISLRYEDLYDNKTRLKELFDINSNVLGELLYDNDKPEGEKLTTSKVYRIVGGVTEGKKKNKRIVGGNWYLIGTGKAALQINAEQKAAEEALKTMKRQGYSKPVSDFYRYLCP